MEVRLLEASHAFEVSDSNGSLIASGEQGHLARLQGPQRGVPGGPWLLPRPAPRSGHSAAPRPPPGKVYQWESPDPKLFDTRAAVDPADSTAEFRLSQGDVYKDLRLRGYDYGPFFQLVLESDLEGEGEGDPPAAWGPGRVEGG